MSEYTDEKAVLEGLFPRGRFVEDEDGTCILRARNSRFARDHVYIQSREKLLGIYYVGGWERYANRLGGLVVKHEKSDGEGILHVRWCQDAADMLPEFTLRDPTYSGQPAERMREITRSRLGTIPEASGAQGSTAVGGSDAYRAQEAK